MKQAVKRAQRDPNRHLMDEPDIGSGEKTPGEQDTQDIILQVPPLPELDEGGATRRSEQERSLDKDEPDAALEQLDPVSPKG